LGKQDKKNKAKPSGISDPMGALPVFDSDERIYQ
jgi:hypothetical protein